MNSGSFCLSGKLLKSLLQFWIITLLDRKFLFGNFLLFQTWNTSATAFCPIRFLLENLLIAFWVKWVCECASWEWVFCSLQFYGLAVCIPRRFLKLSVWSLLFSVQYQGVGVPHVGLKLLASHGRVTALWPLLLMQCYSWSVMNHPTHGCVFDMFTRGAEFRTFLHCCHEPSSLIKNVKLRWRFYHLTFRGKYLVYLIPLMIFFWIKWKQL